MLKIKTKLTRIRTLFPTEYSWVSELAGSDEDYQKLIKCEREQGEVTVDCKACDGYFDVTLPCGFEVSGLAACHLYGFTESGEINWDYLHPLHIDVH